MYELDLYVDVVDAGLSVTLNAKTSNIRITDIRVFYGDFYSIGVMNSVFDAQSQSAQILVADIDKYRFALQADGSGDILVDVECKLAENTNVDESSNESNNDSNNGNLSGGTLMIVIIVICAFVVLLAVAVGYYVYRKNATKSTNDNVQMTQTVAEQSPTSPQSEVDESPTSPQSETA